VSQIGPRCSQRRAGSGQVDERIEVRVVRLARDLSDCRFCDTGAPAKD